MVNMEKQERAKRIMLQIAMHVRLDTTSAPKNYMGPYERNDYFRSAHQCVRCITVDKWSCNVGNSDCKWESEMFSIWDLLRRWMFLCLMRRACFTCKHIRWWWRGWLGVITIAWGIFFSMEKFLRSKALIWLMNWASIYLIYFTPTNALLYCNSLKSLH